MSENLNRRFIMPTVIAATIAMMRMGGGAANVELPIRQQPTVRRHAGRVYSLGSHSPNGGHKRKKAIREARARKYGRKRFGKYSL